MPYLVQQCIDALSWRAAVIFAAAVVAGWGAWRGRTVWILALPLAGESLVLAEFLNYLRFDSVDPAQRATILAQFWTGSCYLPIWTGLCAALLLPGLVGAGRDRLRLGVVLTVVILEVAMVLARRGTYSWPSGAWMVAAPALALAGFLLLRREKPDGDRMSVLATYATFAALVTTGSVPDTYITPFHWGPADPVKRCLLNLLVMRAGEATAVLSLLVSLVALLPLWAEARRVGRWGFTAGISVVLLVCAFGLSTLPLVWTSRAWLDLTCGP